MTKQAERLAFLTNNENLRIVMEILQEGDQIRWRLFNQFMKDLKDYLQHYATTPQDGFELTVTEETDDRPPAVYLRNTTLPRENQYLTYSIQRSAEEKGCCELTLCLEWADDDIWKNPKVTNLPSVQRLGEDPKKAGYKKGRSSWFRYKYVREDDSPDKFLATMIDEENRNSLYRQVSDCFWPLVQTTFTGVAAANEEIARVVKR